MLLVPTGASTYERSQANAKLRKRRRHITHRNDESLPGQNICFIHLNVAEMLHPRFADVIKLLEKKKFFRIRSVIM